MVEIMEAVSTLVSEVLAIPVVLALIGIGVGFKVITFVMKSRK